MGVLTRLRPYGTTPGQGYEYCGVGGGVSEIGEELKKGGVFGV